MSDTSPPNARTWLGRWFWWLLLGMLVLLPVGWWAIGLVAQWRPGVSGFSQTVVSFDAADIELSRFLAQRYPDVRVRDEGNWTRDIPFTLKVADMPENEAMRFVALLFSVRIYREHSLIIVQEQPWWDRHYQIAAKWTKQQWNIDLWPNR